VFSKLKAFSFLSVTVLMSFHSLAEVQLTGEIKQGGLIVGKTSPTNKVYFNDRLLKVSNAGDFVFGFGRDDVESHILKVVEPNGETEQRTLTPTKREYKIQRVNGIAKKIMDPDPKAVARAKEDSKQVKAARKTDSELVEFAGGFIPPIKGVVTGVYGSQRVYNGVPKTPHFGLDYAGKKGDPVKAPATGVVVLNVPDMFYSGGTMIIDHGHGINSTFLHLSDSYVKVGEKVEQGQVVAAVGSTGRSTGPHLDWRVNWFDMRLDPALALKVKPITK
jgi:murein DD-endopeptidase MepM/ murein hydrolase activator NlpD